MIRVFLFYLKHYAPIIWSLGYLDLLQEKGSQRMWRITCRKMPCDLFQSYKNLLRRKGCTKINKPKSNIQKRCFLQKSKKKRTIIICFKKGRTLQISAANGIYDTISRYFLHGCYIFFFNTTYTSLVAELSTTEIILYADLPSQFLFRKSWSKMQLFPLLHRLLFWKRQDSCSHAIISIRIYFKILNHLCRCTHLLKVVWDLEVFTARYQVRQLFSFYLLITNPTAL